jgi:lysophospholipase L1-like esterase
MAIVNIKKTAAGTTFTKDGVRVGFDADASMTSTVSGNLVVFVVDGVRYSFSTSDIVTINDVLFSGTALQADDKLRDEVFISEIIDADATTYIAAMETAGGTITGDQKTALHKCFASLKSQGHYGFGWVGANSGNTRFLGLYFHLGNNAASAGINAAKPGTLNYEYHGTGSPIANAAGLKFNGTDQYAELYIFENATYNITDNLHMAFIQQDYGGTPGVMGGGTGSTGTLLGAYTQPLAARYAGNRLATSSPSFNDFRGMSCLNRNGSSSLKLYHDRIKLSEDTSVSAGQKPDYGPGVGVNLANFPDGFSSLVYQMASVGYAFTSDASYATFCETIHQLNFELGRKTEIVAFGDSIVNGYNTFDGGYVGKLAPARGWLSRILAVNGTTLTSTTPLNVLGSPNMRDRAAADIPYKGGKRQNYLVLGYGANDIGLNFTNYTPALFQTQLSEIVDIAISKGWTGPEIVIVSPTYFEQPGRNVYLSNGSGVTTAADLTRHLAYRAAAAAVSVSKGTKYYDVYDYMSTHGGVSILSDGIHPTDAGQDVLRDGLALVI